MARQRPPESHRQRPREKPNLPHLSLRHPAPGTVRNTALWSKAPGQRRFAPAAWTHCVPFSRFWVGVTASGARTDTGSQQNWLHYSKHFA